MKNTLLLILMVGIMAPAPSLAGALNSDSYFPLSKGFSWVYDTIKKTKKEPEKFEMKVVVEDEWKENGLSGMILTQKDKRGKMREFLVRDPEKGIFIYKLGTGKTLTPEFWTKFTPPVPRVIYPLFPGTKVHWEGRLKNIVMDKHIDFHGEVIGFEDIEVPAGKFHCIKLHYHELRDDEVVDESAWYAEGVGQVKYDGGQYVKELKSFSKP
jgi:hypothetical protein